jgi:hypothetical protein
MHTIGVCVYMRMPFFSYFIVVGLALTLGLLFISDRVEPLGSPVPTSQIIGIAKSFKPEPERSPYKITGTNFAAAYRPAPARAAEEPKPVRRAESHRQQRPATADATDRGVPRWKYIAQNPFAAFMGIH